MQEVMIIPITITKLSYENSQTKEGSFRYGIFNVHEFSPQWIKSEGVNALLLMKAPRQLGLFKVIQS